MNESERTTSMRCVWGIICGLGALMLAFLVVLLVSAWVLTLSREEVRDTHQSHTVYVSNDSWSDDESYSAASAPVATGSPQRTGDGSTGELSVAPAVELRYPADRPAWIDENPSLDGKVHRWPVSSSPSSTAELSRRALKAQLRATAETYVETLLDAPEAPGVLALRDDWIDARLDPDRSYEGEIDAGDEVLYEAAAELRFGQQDRQWLRSQWASHQVGQRMVGLGAMTVGGTILLLMTGAGLSIIVRRAEHRREASS